MKLYINKGEKYEKSTIIILLSSFSICLACVATLILTKNSWLKFGTGGLRGVIGAELEWNLVVTGSHSIALI